MRKDKMNVNEGMIASIEEDWSTSVLETLHEYIRIPNQSPAYDSECLTNGHLHDAARLLFNWAVPQPVKGLKVELVEPEGRTPLILATIPASSKAGEDIPVVLMYGHLDKQPPMHESWDPELGGAWDPLLIGDKLYGRGGADDGYSIFAAIGAIKALQRTGQDHGRIVIVIEASEESGSIDLPYYIDTYKEQIGDVGLVVCLDSGCGNYEQFWLTTSLRGMLAGELRVDILKEGVHSGKASGIVPSSFRIIRQLLSRVEDPETGRIIVPELHVEVPQDRLVQLRDCASLLGTEVYTQFPFVSDAKPVQTDSMEELLLSELWRPTLSVTGVDGIPSTAMAGNVLRTHTTLTLSFRLPPTCDAEKASAVLKNILEANPPYGAKVSFNATKCGAGWNSPSMAPWLEKAVETGSDQVFKRPYAASGEGGSIPFMGMLGKKFPKAQFVVTGVLGPASNAHGPNEFLHIPQAKSVTRVVATILNAHFNHFTSI